MNMKWFCSVGVVALLAACSEDQELVGYKTRSVDSLEELAEVACKSSNDGEQILVPQEDDPIFTCKSGVWKNGHDVVVGEKKSSSSAKSSSSTDDKSSSSAKSSSSSKRVVEDDDDDSEEVISKRSSSSKETIDPEMSSSSIVINNNPLSSSAGVVIASNLGSCAPTTATIEKGGSTTWSFKMNPSNSAGVSVMDIVKSGKFDWTFTGAEPGTETVEKRTNSSAVTYANSGSYEASVTVAIGTATETIKCAPLQVNGDPITGCECSTDAPAVDFTVTPDVAWTVTGCKSAADISYEWDGAAGTDSFTKTFAAATAGYSPKLKVKNSDNTAIDVTCPAVRATEGAEYVLTFKPNNSLKDSYIDVPNEACISLVVDWKDEYYISPRLTLSCSLSGLAQNVEMTMTYQGMSTSEVGSYVITNMSVEVESNVKPERYTLESPVCISFSGAETARCEARNF